jgi:hypothetical protein
MSERERERRGSVLGAQKSNEYLERRIGVNR